MHQRTVRKTSYLRTSSTGSDGDRKHIPHCSSMPSVANLNQIRARFDGLTSIAGPTIPAYLEILEAGLARRRAFGAEDALLFETADEADDGHAHKPVDSDASLYSRYCRGRRLRPFQPWGPLSSSGASIVNSVREMLALI
jgi:hypothetical protein